MTGQDRSTDPFGDDQTLLPAIIQNADSGKVLMLGYMNREALETTLRTGRVTFFSRSKGRLWTKGESSGHFLSVREILWDCDRDTLLVMTDPQGPTCHTGTESCFDGRTLFKALAPRPAFETLDRLLQVIRDRRTQDPDTSYVARLLSGPTSSLLKKLVEESGEIMAAVYEDNPAAIRSEMADLIFHLLVTMERTGIPWKTVMEELDRRTGKGGLTEKRERLEKNPNPKEIP